jgi:hypothetical protein
MGKPKLPMVFKISSIFSPPRFAAPNVKVDKIGIFTDPAKTDALCLGKQYFVSDTF